MILSRARVTRVTEDGEIYVEAPSLGIGQDFGPVEVTSGSFEPEDRVLIGTVEVAEDIVIIAKMNARTTDDPGGGGSVQAFYSETEPLANRVGNLWINSGNGNILNFWDGSTWIPVRDAGIETALQNATDAVSAAAAANTAAANAASLANTAQVTADRKIETFHQPEPPTGPHPEGSLWADSNNGNRLHRWFNNGATFEWLPVMFGGQAIEFGSIGPDQLDPSIPTGPDGNPPSEAPVVLATPFPGGVNLRWNQITNHDPVTYVVRAGTVSGGPTTVVLETESTYAPVREIAGTPLSTTAPTYFIVVPTDVDGDGPASDEVSATARRLTQAEIDDAFSDFLDDIQETAQEAHQQAFDNAAELARAKMSATAELAFMVEPLAPADNHLVVHYAATAPTLNDTTDVDDIWYNTETGVMNHWRGSGLGWELVDDFRLQDALDQAQNDTDTADDVIEVFWQATMPASVDSSSGDIWFDTDDADHPYRYSGTAWLSVLEVQIANAVQNAADALHIAYNSLDGSIKVQATADGFIRVHYAVGPPWSNGTVQPSGVVADIWYNTSGSDVARRWDGSNWVLTATNVRDGLRYAQHDALIADGRITAWYQTNQSVKPTAAENDILFRTDLHFRKYRLVDGIWQPLQPTSNDELNDTIGGALDHIDAIEITANGKNRIYWSTDPPPGVGAFVGGDVWFQKSPSPELQIIKMWQYDGGETDWFEQELADAMFANLDVLGHLQAGSIGAEYLLIGDFTNHIQNPSFEYGDGFAGWIGQNAFTNIDTTIKRTGDQSMRFTGNATLKAASAVTVEHDEQFLFTVWYRTSSAVTPANCRFAMFDSDGVEHLGWDIFTTANFASTPSTNFIRASGTYRVGAGPDVIELYPGFVNVDNGQTVWIDDVTVRRKGTGELIVDGSILATKIEADSITGEQINSEWLSSLRVDADKINAGQITSNLAMSGEFKICKLLSDDTGDLTPDPASNVIEFNLVSGMRFRIPNGTDVDGNVVYDDILHLPIGQTDPATGKRMLGLFRGIVQSDQVTSRVIEMTGDAHSGTPVVSKILSGATLRLESKVEDPGEAPTITFGPRYSNWPPVSGFSEMGMGHNGAFIVQGRLDETNNGVQLIRGRYINPTTGVVDHSDSNSYPFYAVAGFTCTGGYYYVLHKFLNGSSPWTISRFNRSDWTPTGHDLNVENMMGGGYKTGCLGDAGRDDCVAFAYRNVNDEMRIRYFTLTLNDHGTLPNRTSLTNVTQREMIGVPNVDVVAAGNRFFWFGGGTYDDSKSWNAPEAMSGAMFWNGQYVSTSQKGKLAKYNEEITDTGTLLKAAFTRVQTTPSVLQTMMSPVSGAMWPTRQYATISTSDLIPGTNDVYIYAGGIDNQRTNMRIVLGKLQGQTSTTLSTPPVAGVNPPLTSGFLGATYPGAIESKATIPGDTRSALGFYGDGTARIWGLKQPSIKRRNNTVFSVNGGGVSDAVRVNWSTPVWDANFITWDSVNQRFYFSWAGTYLVICSFSWAPATSSTGTRCLDLRLNGVLHERNITNGATPIIGQNYSGLISVATNDYVETWVWQNSGSTIDARNNEYEKYISIIRFGL